MTPSNSISITAGRSGKTLSAAQKKFNNLIDKLTVQRALLKEWQDAIPIYQTRVATEFEPLYKQFCDATAALAAALDACADGKGLSKQERGLLAEEICEMAAQLRGTPHEEAMKLLYNRHSGSDADAEVNEARQRMREVMEEELGIKMPDDLDLDDDEDLMNLLQARLLTQEADDERKAAEDQHRQSKRKPTAAQQRAQADKEKAGQSIRDVYRKLASALHPDREPDATERERKTGLMQRVNQAYERNDLLTLLQLQLEVELIDLAHIENIAEGRLQHYNKVLTEQLRELQTEVGQIEFEFRERFGFDFSTRVTPLGLNKLFVARRHALEGETFKAERLKSQVSDRPFLKRWLKAQGQTRRAEYRMEAALADWLDDRG